MSQRWILGEAVSTDSDLHCHMLDTNIADDTVKLQMKNTRIILYTGKSLINNKFRMNNAFLLTMKFIVFTSAHLNY